MIRLVLLLITFASPSFAEEIVLGLSRDSVAITATFEGSDILVFGAIKREEPIPRTNDLGVIVTVTGPDTPVTVRRKERKLGIWVNSEAVEVDAAPSFYAVATSGRMMDVLQDTEDLRNRITIDRSIRSVGSVVSNSPEFTRALIRIRAGAGLYQVLEGAVDVEEQTLFRTAIELPANLTEGDYRARIFLTRNGQVVDEYVTTIPVAKVGLERWLYNTAHNQAPLYGLMSLAIAIAAGWTASAAFSLLRR